MGIIELVLLVLVTLIQFSGVFNIWALLNAKHLTDHVRAHLTLCKLVASRVLSGIFIINNEDLIDSSTAAVFLALISFNFCFRCSTYFQAVDVEISDRSYFRSNVLYWSHCVAWFPHNTDLLPSKSQLHNRFGCNLEKSILIWFFDPAPWNAVFVGNFKRSQMNIKTADHRQLFAYVLPHPIGVQYVVRAFAILRLHDAPKIFATVIPASVDL